MKNFKNLLPGLLVIQKLATLSPALAE